MLAEMEQKGEVLIMKALTGSFKDVALPKLGAKVMDQSTGLYTIGLNDPGSSGYGRYRCVWWDTVRERGRAADRVDQSESLRAILHRPRGSVALIIRLRQDVGGCADRGE